MLLINIAQPTPFSDSIRLTNIRHLRTAPSVESPNEQDVLRDQWKGQLGKLGCD